MASCDLPNFGPCLSQFCEIQLFSRNLTDFVNYKMPVTIIVTFSKFFVPKTDETQYIQ